MELSRLIRAYSLRSQGNDSNSTIDLGAASSYSIYFETLPYICVFGVITNLINVIVFTSPKLKERSFRYMLANSISCIIYLGFFITDFWILKEFCKDCEISKWQFSQTFFFLVDDYFSSVCALFCIITDLVLSLERLFIVMNKNYLSRYNYKFLLFLCLVFSLVYYSPVLFLKYIDKDDQAPEGVEHYKAYVTQFGASQFGKSVTVILSIVRIFLSSVIIFGLNVLIAVKLTKRLKKKEQGPNVGILVARQPNNSLSKTTKSVSFYPSQAKNRKSQRFTRNITFVVIISGFIYNFGTTPYILAYAAGFIFHSSNFLQDFTFFSMNLLFLSHGVNFFIYVSFNNLFKKTLHGILKYILITEQV